MFEEFGTVIPRKKREDLRYRWKLSNLLTFLADTDTSISEFAIKKKKNKKINTLSKKTLPRNTVQGSLAEQLHSLFFFFWCIKCFGHEQRSL